MNNNLNEEEMVKSNIAGEVYFQNPAEEYNYFLTRMKAINKYSNEFFIESAKLDLANRYLRALALLREENSFDSEPLADVYYDILSRLGIDSYIIEQEVDNYIKTHDIDYSKKSNIVVSSKRR